MLPVEGCWCAHATPCGSPAKSSWVWATLHSLREGLKAGKRRKAGCREIGSLITLKKYSKMEITSLGKKGRTSPCPVSTEHCKPDCHNSLSCRSSPPLSPWAEGLSGSQMVLMCRRIMLGGCAPPPLGTWGTLKGPVSSPCPVFPVGLALQQLSACFHCSVRESDGSLLWGGCLQWNFWEYFEAQKPAVFQESCPTHGGSWWRCLMCSCSALTGVFS